MVQIDGVLLVQIDLEEFVVRCALEILIPALDEPPSYLSAHQMIMTLTN